MIKTYQMLLEELKNYKNPKTKIQRMVTNKEIYPITKGLYETNKDVERYYLADPIYSPSYISFESALSFHELIPERVYAITNATYNKRKNKEYHTMFGLYMYQDVPKQVFPYGVDIINVNGYVYKMATKEKALLDMLYKIKPMQNMKDMRALIFEDLRINEMILDTLDKNIVSELAPLYHSRNVSMFANMLTKEKLYD